MPSPSLTLHQSTLQSRATASFIRGKSDQAPALPRSWGGSAPSPVFLSHVQIQSPWGIWLILIITKGCGNNSGQAKVWVYKQAWASVFVCRAGTESCISRMGRTTHNLKRQFVSESDTCLPYLCPSPAPMRTTGLSQQALYGPAITVFPRSFSLCLCDHILLGTWHTAQLCS